MTQTYGYSFDILVPGADHVATTVASDELLDSPTIANRQPVVSNNGDIITLSFIDGGEDIVEILRHTRYLARCAMEDIDLRGIIIRARCQPIYENSVADDDILPGNIQNSLSIIAMTDTLFRIELED